jgi:hypothetical protein
MVRRRSSRLPGVRHPRLESQRMTPSLQAPEQDLEGGSDSARVGADPVHWGNQRFETLEDTREEWALPIPRVVERGNYQSPYLHVSRRRL